MKLLSLMKFQLKSVLPWLSAFYLAMVASFFITNYLTGSTGTSMTATLFVGNSMVLAFVLGLFSFRQNFFMALAQGVSRKTVYLSSLLLLISLSVFNALISAVTALSLGPLEHDYTLLRERGFVVLMTSNQVRMLSPWVFYMSAIAALVGYVLAILLYSWRGMRFSTRAMWVLAGLLILQVFLHPWISIFGALSMSLMYASLDAAASNLAILHPIFILLILLFSGVSWLLIRRATLSAPTPPAAAEQPN